MGETYLNQTPAKKRSRQNSLGYTLTELMVVVGLIGVVSSIAYPTYTNYTRDADRAQAQADLYTAAQILERGFTSNRTYDFLSTAQKDEIDDGNPRYDISILTPTTITFTIEAVASGSRDVYDLSLNNLGTEGFRVYGGSGAFTTTGWESIPD